jgi:hypothetical protein
MKQVLISTDEIERLERARIHLHQMVKEPIKVMEILFHVSDIMYQITHRKYEVVDEGVLTKPLNEFCGIPLDSEEVESRLKLYGYVKHNKVLEVYQKTAMNNLIKNVFADNLEVYDQILDLILDTRKALDELIK